ncbi:MAG: A/G-specific adenine glycosylase [Promethearchaeota archaeon]
MKQQQLIPDAAEKLRTRFREEGMSGSLVAEFRHIIYSYYRKHKRRFPFREEETTRDPYRVLISEVMLQQTQANRVVEKFLNFVKHFPDLKALHESTIEDVLKQWVGLGYNRRALALKKIAGILLKKFNGKIPPDVKILESLPFIGPNTAASISTFAFNRPNIFIETNIRTVYIYFFFNHDKSREKIDDRKILPLVESTLDRERPREWYYALMDYGVMLKKKYKNVFVRKSKVYVKQKKFEGSTRQARGKILKQLLTGPANLDGIIKNTALERGVVDLLLKRMVNEGFISLENGVYAIRRT